MTMRKPSWRLLAFLTTLGIASSWACGPAPGEHLQPREANATKEVAAPERASGGGSAAREVTGTFRCAGGEKSPAIAYALVDGLALPDKIEGDKCVDVMLFTEPMDLEKFWASWAESLKSLELAAWDLDVEQWVAFTVCRTPGRGPEVTLVGTWSQEVNFNASGFGGMFDPFTKEVGIEGDRVSAVLKTDEETAANNCQLDIGFDLPIHRPEPGS
jgi:hypothetical protein